MNVCLMATFFAAHLRLRSASGRDLFVGPCEGLGEDGTHGAKSALSQSPFALDQLFSCVLQLMHCIEASLVKSLCLRLDRFLRQSIEQGPRRVVQGVRRLDASLSMWVSALWTCAFVKLGESLGVFVVRGNITKCLGRLRWQAAD